MGVGEGGGRERQKERETEGGEVQREGGRGMECILSRGSLSGCLKLSGDEVAG